MNYEQAVAWLLRMDAERGSTFHLDDVLDDQKYDIESEARDFFDFCAREGFDPYALAMSVAPSFVESTRRNAG